MGYMQVGMMTQETEVVMRVTCASPPAASSSLAWRASRGYGAQTFERSRASRSPPSYVIDADRPTGLFVGAGQNSRASPFF